jgi:hypothetical protein
MNEEKLQQVAYVRFIWNVQHLHTHIAFIRGFGTAQWYSAELRAGWSGVRVPGDAGNFSLHHRVQTGSGAQPASYPVSTRDSFPGGKEARAWSWPLTSKLKRKDKFTFYLYRSHKGCTCLPRLLTVPGVVVFESKRAVWKVRGLAAVHRCYAEGGGDLCKFVVVVVA